MGWRERLRALGSIPAFFQLVWETHRAYTMATIGLRILRAGAPVAGLWDAKLIIDGVVSARRGRPNISRLWSLVVLGVLIIIICEVLEKASPAVGGVFSSLC